MKTKLRSILCAVLALCLLLGCLAGCGAEQPAAIETEALACIHEPEFGGVYIENTIGDFNARGFAYGDSVTVTFSNGYVLDDLPYYNGYYTVTGEPLLVAYPGYDYIKAAINNGDDLWIVAGLDESCTAVIALKTRGAYLDIQEARDIHYEDDRSLFDSDEVFANFRGVSVGNLKENMLYRSASPCDNQHNRAPYVDSLIAQAGVQYIVDLADNEEKIAGYLAKEDFASPYFLSLYENGQVIPLALNMNYGSDEFKEKVVRGLCAMAEHDGPYLVHCTEGKDRTGFFCALLEAFAGATYDEIAADYMLTYDNYYGITKESDPAKYETIQKSLLVPMLQSIAGAETDVENADFAACAETYLLDAGMTQAQLDALRAQLTAA